MPPCAPPGRRRCKVCKLSRSGVTRLVPRNRRRCLSRNPPFSALVKPLRRIVRQHSASERPRLSLTKPLTKQANPRLPFQQELHQSRPHQSRPQRKLRQQRSRRLQAKVRMPKAPIHLCRCFPPTSQCSLSCPKATIAAERKCKNLFTSPRTNLTRSTQPQAPLQKSKLPKCSSMNSRSMSRRCKPRRCNIPESGLGSRRKLRSANGSKRKRGKHGLAQICTRKWPRTNVPECRSRSRLKKGGRKAS